MKQSQSFAPRQHTLVGLVLLGALGVVAASFGSGTKDAIGGTSPVAPFQRALAGAPVSVPAAVQRVAGSTADGAVGGVHPLSIAGASSVAGAVAYLREEQDNLCLYAGVGGDIGRACWPVVNLAQEPAHPLITSVGYDDKRVVFVVAPDAVDGVVADGAVKALSRQNAVVFSGPNKAVEVTTLSGAMKLGSWTLGA